MMLDYWSVSHDVEVLGYICLYIYIYIENISIIFRSDRCLPGRQVRDQGRGIRETFGTLHVLRGEAWLATVDRILLGRSLTIDGQYWEANQNGTLKMSWWKISDSANLGQWRQWQDYVSYPAAVTFLIAIDPFLWVMIDSSTHHLEDWCKKNATWCNIIDRQIDR